MLTVEQAREILRLDTADNDAIIEGLLSAIPDYIELTTGVTAKQELNAELVLMDTTLKECLERIRNDPQRNRSRRKFERLAIEWHEKYSKSLKKPFIPPNLTN